MNDEFVDSIITNLKIISMLQINERLCIRSGHLQIDKDSNIQFIKRWLNRDSRNIMMSFIKDLIKNISVLLERYSNNKKESINESEKIWILTRVNAEMDPVLTGFGNLKTTYSFDPITIVFIENVVIKIKELSNNIKELINHGNGIGNGIPVTIINSSKSK